MISMRDHALEIHVEFRLEVMPHVHGYRGVQMPTMPAGIVTGYPVPRSQKMKILILGRRKSIVELTRQTRLRNRSPYTGRVDRRRE